MLSAAPLGELVFTEWRLFLSYHLAITIVLHKVVNKLQTGPGGLTTSADRISIMADRLQDGSRYFFLHFHEISLLQVREIILCLCASNVAFACAGRPLCAPLSELDLGAIGHERPQFELKRAN